MSESRLKIPAESMEDAEREDDRRILWRIVATIERENAHVRRNARRKAQ